MGDVIGDLNQRRGRILGIDAAGRQQRIRALVPQSRAVQVRDDAALPLAGARGAHA